MPRRNRNRGKKQNTSRVQRVGRANQRPSEPLWMGAPTLETGTIVDQTYRYRCTSITGLTLTVGMALRACGLMALDNFIATTGLLAPLAASFRLKRIRIWSPITNLGNTSAVSTAVASASVDFDVDAVNGGNPGLQYVDTTNSQTRPAFVDIAPPARCFASFWHSQVEAAEALCIIGCSLSSIVDLHIEWVLNDDDGIGGVGLITNTISNQTGHVYYPNLGSVPVLVPIGRTANGNA